MGAHLKLVGNRVHNQTVNELSKLLELAKIGGIDSFACVLKTESNFIVSATGILARDVKTIIQATNFLQEKIVDEVCAAA